VRSEGGGRSGWAREQIGSFNEQLGGGRGIGGGKEGEVGEAGRMNG